MKCFYCEQIITDEQIYKIFPLDKPYVNLYLHIVDCYDRVSVSYVKDNIKKVYEYIDNIGIKKKKANKSGE